MTIFLGLNNSEPSIRLIASLGNCWKFEDSNQTFRCIVTNCETGLAPRGIAGNVTFVIYTDSNGDIENKRSETMSWAKNVSDGFVVRNADTIDENNNIIGVSVSADAYLTVDD